MFGTKNSFCTYKRVAILVLLTSSAKEESSLPIIATLTTNLPLFSSTKISSLKRFNWNY
jgi:hypothetical protein